MTRPIDTHTETIISVEDAAKHVSRIAKKKRNRSLIQRWGNRGVAGVRLATIRIGSEIYTSREALDEFLNEAAKSQRTRHSQRTAAGIAAARLANDDGEARELGI